MDARLAACLCLALVTVPLAGCVGPLADDDPGNSAEPVQGTDADGGPDRQGRADASDAGTAGPTDLVPLTYTGIDAPVSRTQWANGTFQAQESCLGGGCLQDAVLGTDPTEHRTDVTETIPAGVPVDVRLDLSYDRGLAGFLSAWINATGATFYAYDAETDGTEQTVTATLVRSETGTVSAVVDAGSADPQGTDYALRVHVSANRSLVAPGVPVAVDLTADQGPLLVDSRVNASELTVVAWGPDDQVIQRSVDADGPVEIALPDPGSRDRLVVAVWGAEATVLQAPVDDPARLQALTLSHQLGDPTALEPAQGTSFTFDQPTVPYGIGLYVRTDPPGHVSGQIEATLTSPNGTVATTDEIGGIIITSDGYTSWLGWAPANHTAVVPGIYEATFDYEVAANMEAGTVVVTFDRPR